MKKTLLPFILLIFIFTGCQNNGREKTKNATKQVAILTPPDFNSDSAYRFIEQQLQFGYRVPGTPSHKACGKWLVEKLETYADTVLIQTATIPNWDNTTFHIKNIMGRFNTTQQHRVLLFAHWDSRFMADNAANPEQKNKPIPGANDGASGIGVLLEIARQLKIKNPDIGVDILFFDAEDQGKSGVNSVETWCLGSQYWAANKMPAGYKANYGICLDMVGGYNAVFTREYHSMRFAPEMMQRVWDFGVRLGYGNMFSYQQTRFVGTDDHVPVSEIGEIPSINIIQYNPGTRSFAPYWHTHNDNIHAIDSHTLQAVGETVLQTIYSEKAL